MNITTKRASVITGLAAAAVILFQVGCGTGSAETAEKTPLQPEQNEMTKEDMIARGRYLATISGCHDCHSPKVFGPQGMSLDSTRLLSGHPANSPMPAIDPKALTPGNWVLFAPDLTAAVGPWGISYSANLTPDSTTGIGSWDEGTFIKSLRTGKHMGMDNGRPILPPMPWHMIAKMKDEDLKSLYAFFRTVQPVKNQVPGPVPPDQAAAMAKKK